MAKGKKLKKQQEKVEQLITTLSKEMLGNPVIQVSMFYLLVVGMRKAYESTLDPEELPQDDEYQAFMEGYWNTIWQKFFGPFAAQVPRPTTPPLGVSELHLLELAVLAAIPLSAGGNLTKSIGDIIDVLT